MLPEEKARLKIDKKLEAAGWRVVSRDTIRQNDYNLNISRYVDSSDKPEQFDIYSYVRWYSS